MLLVSRNCQHKVDAKKLAFCCIALGDPLGKFAECLECDASEESAQQRNETLVRMQLVNELSCVLPGNYPQFCAVPMRRKLNNSCNLARRIMHGALRRGRYLRHCTSDDVQRILDKYDET